MPVHPDIRRNKPKISKADVERSLLDTLEKEATGQGFHATLNCLLNEIGLNIDQAARCVRMITKRNCNPSQLSGTIPPYNGPEIFVEVADAVATVIYQGMALTDEDKRAIDTAFAHRVKNAFGIDNHKPYEFFVANAILYKLGINTSPAPRRP